MKNKLLLALSTFVFLMACSSVAVTTYENISVEHAKTLIKSDITILDVRTAQEVSGGMIPKAVHIDFHASDFESKVSKLDKTKPILVYCKSGGRSESSMKVFEKQDFVKVYNLLGGYTAWTNQ
jgi:rhodanese-related sulfurtransferase